MANTFYGIPNRFNSYQNLDKWLRNYEEKKNKFNVFVSESLVKVYKKRDYVDFNPDLIYDRIHYKCLTRAKHDEDMPDNCESRLILSTSPHKQNLVVDDFVSEHNHPPIVIGRRGSTKQRQLLFEAAVELRETMRKRSQQTRRTVLPRNPENNIVNRKAIMKEAVIRLSRIDPHHTVDFGFIEFVENLRPKVDLTSVLSNKLVLQPHYLLIIDKNNVLNHLKFDLMKFKKYLSEAAFMQLQVLLAAKK
ncbi:uncharacterized protein LOC141533522 [Cotesia typhae]|uniref:uncharacterized protein LOC141533522 n=1 Tax=Cotesia typhae TaxID=2053667 RepID=UPI003D688F6E